MPLNEPRLNAGGQTVRAPHGINASDGLRSIVPAVSLLPGYLMIRIERFYLVALSHPRLDLIKNGLTVREFDGSLNGRAQYGKLRGNQIVPASFSVV